MPAIVDGSSLGGALSEASAHQAAGAAGSVQELAGDAGAGVVVVLLSGMADGGVVVVDRALSGVVAVGGVG